MTEENKTDKHETLGGYLVRTRNEKGLKFESVTKETKIPPHTLQAIDGDDYGELPADAFARGFYALYAKCLDLNPEDILDRFERERTNSPTQGRFSPPSQQEKAVNIMAARPSMMKRSTFGFTLVIIIAVISFLCWYFSWNPATYLSEQLRSFQTPTTEEQRSGIAMENAIDSKYFLTVDFIEDTTITVTIDSGSSEKEVYTKGSTRSWYANSSISLILPGSAQVELFFNGSKLQLPAPDNGGFISLNLP